MKLFVPLWHMPERAVSGGLYRTKRLLETMRAFELLVADSDTSDANAEAVRGRIVRYPAKRLYAYHRALFPVFRVLNWSWSCLAMIAIGLAAGDIDAVYAPNSELPHVSFAAWIVGRLRQVPIIFGNLNIVGTQLWTLNRILHQHVDAIITLSRGLADELRAEGIDVPIYVGTVGVDDLHPLETLPIAYDAVYIARHAPEKGALDMVEIVYRCAQRMPQILIAMVGPCSDAMRCRLEEQARELGVERNIRFIGPVSESEKWRLLAQSRVCLFPSHAEGWGIVPIEAHLCGIPVVGYDLPAYEETIRHSPAATLVPLGDVDAFADAALAKVRDFAGPSMQARTWAQQFTWDRAARLEETLLMQILSAKLPRTAAPAPTGDAGQADRSAAGDTLPLQ